LRRGQRFQGQAGARQLILGQVWDQELGTLREGKRSPSQVRAHAKRWLFLAILATGENIPKGPSQPVAGWSRPEDWHQA
jgi:hypothetical protein